MLLPSCEAYTLTSFNIDPFTFSIMTISSSDTLFTSKILPTSSSLPTILIPFLLSSAPFWNSLQPPPMFLALLLFHFASCRHSIFIFLCSIMSATSFPFPVIVPIFKVPILMTVRLPFRSSRYFFTHLPPLFLLLLFLSPAI